MSTTTDFRSQVLLNLIPISGLRPEQVSALPTAVAGNNGQVVQLTSDSHGYMNVNGSWKKFTNPAMADVQGLTAALGNKSDTGHSHSLSSGSIAGILPAEKGGLGIDPTSGWERGAIPIFDDTTDIFQQVYGTNGQLLQFGTNGPQYVDNKIDKILPTAAFKRSVLASSNSNMALSGLSTTSLAIDGINIPNGGRVLLFGQSTASQNGIYQYNMSAGTLTRTADADNAEKLANAIVGIDSGTRGGQFYSTTFKTTDTINTTAVNWFRVIDRSMANVAGGYPELNASNLIPQARLGGATATANNFLRGDGVWAPPTAAQVGAEPTIAAGATTQYYRGDKTWQTLLGTTSTTALAGNTPLNSITAPTAAVGLNSQRITNLADPTADTDAANKRYVDNAVNGISPKESVRLASATGVNYGLTGTATIDGVTTATGDRVLMKDQTNPAQNGIYVVNNSGAWTRSADADSTNDIESAFTFVEEGNTNANTGWLQTTDNVTIGTTAQTWVMFSGAGQIDAGTGLTKTGNQINVIGTANRIVANADSIDIASTYVGQTSITTLGTITTGQWAGDAIAIERGGTGGSTVTQARLNLKVPSQATGVLGTANAGVWQNVVHNLSYGLVPVVSIMEVSTNKLVGMAVEYVDTNTIRVRADVPMQLGDYAYTILLPSIA